MASCPAIASAPVVPSTTPTPLDSVLGPRNHSGPVGILRIPDHGSSVPTVVPSATVNTVNRHDVETEIVPVKDSPIPSEDLTLNSSLKSVNCVSRFVNP